MVAFAAVFGSLVGSFLNVVVYRVPAGRSIVSPPSACPVCNSHIRPWDNIPILSWLVLRGRCRDCGTRISVRYPLVELGTALLFAVVAAVFLAPFVNALADEQTSAIVSAALALCAFLYLAAVSVALGLIDVDTHTLPDRIVFPSYAVAALLLGGSSVLAGHWLQLATTATGAVTLCAFYFLLAFLRPGGMGLGDVKLAGLLGLYLGWLGWGPLVVGAFAAFLFGGVYGVVLLAARRANRKSGIPFGPWMLAGAWFGIFFGGAAWSAYLNLIGVA